VLSAASNPSKPSAGAPRWRPETLVDEPEEALRRLIEEKLRSEAVVAPDVADTNVVDLLEALRRSVSEACLVLTPLSCASPAPCAASSPKGGPRDWRASLGDENRFPAVRGLPHVA
jgi:hypothetical protein